ncbi:MAG: hypothetical protein KGL39_00725 [Patescibacteria group bacterium]|nr:hypothetical protein [Patescibacteria group bacterium]
MTVDAEQFAKALDGRWICERYELEDTGQLRVHYRSMTNSLITWSNHPDDFGKVPPVGTICWVGIAWEGKIKEATI